MEVRQPKLKMVEHLIQGVHLKKSLSYQNTYEFQERRENLES